MAARIPVRSLAAVALALLLAGCGGSVGVTVESSSSVLATPQANSPVATTAEASASITTVSTSSAVATTSSAALASTLPPVPPTATAAQTAATTGPRGAASTTASQASGLSLNAAEQVTSDFLSSLQQNPSGKNSVQYLSTTLQQQLQQGRPMATIVGVQNMYQSYTVGDPILRAGGRAVTVQATLHYTAGPSQRLVTLVPENGAWRIDDIEATG